MIFVLFDPILNVPTCRDSGSPQGQQWTHENWIRQLLSFFIKRRWFQTPSRPFAQGFTSFRDVGEYLRDEVTFTPLPSTSSSFNSLSGHIILIGAKVLYG